MNRLARFSTFGLGHEKRFFAFRFFDLVVHRFEFFFDLIATLLLGFPLDAELGGFFFGLFFAAERFDREVVATGIDSLHRLAFPFFGAFYGFIVLNFETFFVCNALGNLRLCRIELLLHVADRLI